MSDRQQNGPSVLLCARCQRYFVPPRFSCPVCDSNDLESVALASEGEIYTYSIIHMPFEAFKDQVPMIVTEIRLCDGIVVPARILNPENCNITIGQRVRFVERINGANWFKLEGIRIKPAAL